MVYLASPFFNGKELKVYKKVIDYLRNTLKYDLFVPQEHEVPNAWDMSNEDWAKVVFQMDLEALEACDTVVVLNWGLYSDTGTAWECGYAYAKGKKIYNIMLNNETNDFSLMLYGGCSVNIRPKENYFLK